MHSVKTSDRTSAEVESFYNDFSRKFIDDIVQGNDRVARQLIFFANAIPSTAQRILVVGFGSGQCAHFIASKIAPQARLTGLDISSENLGLAEALFSHPRVEYRKLDVVTDPIEGRWDVIVLPDVYEHIPIASRPVLHSKMNQGLTADGRVLLTIPSPGKQDSLRASGKGLQIVDETVTLSDLVRLSEDVGGLLTYFNMISVWETDDYVHAVIERGAERVRIIQKTDMIPLKGWAKRTIWTRGRGFLANRLNLAKLQEALHRRLILRTLQRQARYRSRDF